MSINNLSVVLYPAECPEKPVNDIPLHLVFLCFHADDVLRIFSAVLMEQRIVFMSSNYALLTTVMEVRFMLSSCSLVLLIVYSLSAMSSNYVLLSWWLGSCCHASVVC